MSFLKPKTKPSKTADESKAIINAVIDSGKLTEEQLSKIADLMQNDAKLQAALKWL